MATEREREREREQHHFTSGDPHRNLRRLIPKVRALIGTMCAGRGGLGQCYAMLCAVRSCF
eukprot:7989905-Pyramimonas_sp.AAC.1